MTQCIFCGQEGAHSDRSNSPFGQAVHDHLGRVFDYSDLDGICRKQATGIVRMFESKHPGQEIKPSQRRIFPELVRATRWPLYVVEFDARSNEIVRARHMRIDGTLVPFPYLEGALTDPRVGAFIRCETTHEDVLGWAA